MFCQQTSPKRWFTNMNMTSYCDVTNSVYPETMTTVRHCAILEFGMGAYNQAVAPGITRPLHCTDSEAAVANHYIESSGVTATTPLELVCASTVYPLLAKNANSATLPQLPPLV